MQIKLLHRSATDLALMLMKPNTSYMVVTCNIFNRHTLIVKYSL